MRTLSFCMFYFFWFLFRFSFHRLKTKQNKHTHTHSFVGVYSASPFSSEPSYKPHSVLSGFLTFRTFLSGRKTRQSHGPACCKLELRHEVTRSEKAQDTRGPPGPRPTLRYRQDPSKQEPTHKGQKMTWRASRWPPGRTGAPWHLGQWCKQWYCVSSNPIAKMSLT